MNLEAIRLLYDYHYWANARILNSAAGATQDELDAPTGPGPGSLRAIFVHIFSSEWVWRSRWQGISPAAMLDANDYPTLEAVRERWQQEESDMRAFIAGLAEADLQKIVSYSNTEGHKFSRPLWSLMAHLVNHGTQHRSEAAIFLTRLGRSPGDMDFTVFLTETGR